MLLDEVKTVLGISDTLKDTLLGIYIRKGTTLVNIYMNFPNIPVTDPVTPPVDVATVYADAIIEYVTLCYRKKGIEGLKSFGQGGRSGTYEDGLQQSVKALLPSPFIRMASVRCDPYAV